MSDMMFLNKIIAGKTRILQPIPPPIPPPKPLPRQRKAAQMRLKCPEFLPLEHFQDKSIRHAVCQIRLFHLNLLTVLKALS